MSNFWSRSCSSQDPLPPRAADRSLNRVGLANAVDDTRGVQFGCHTEEAILSGTTVKRVTKGQHATIAALDDRLQGAPQNSAREDRNNTRGGSTTCPRPSKREQSFRTNHTRYGVRRFAGNGGGGTHPMGGNDEILPLSPNRARWTICDRMGGSRHGPFAPTTDPVCSTPIGLPHKGNHCQKKRNHVQRCPSTNRSSKTEGGHQRRPVQKTVCYIPQAHHRVSADTHKSMLLVSFPFRQSSRCCTTRGRCNTKRNMLDRSLSMVRNTARPRIFALRNCVNGWRTHRPPGGTLATSEDRTMLEAESWYSEPRAKP